MLLNDPKSPWRIAIGMLAVFAALGLVGRVVKQRMSVRPVDQGTGNTLQGNATPETSTPSTAEGDARSVRQGVVAQAGNPSRVSGDSKPIAAGESKSVAMLTPTERLPEHAGTPTEQKTQTQVPVHAQAPVQAQAPVRAAEIQGAKLGTAAGTQAQLSPFPIKPGQPLVLLQPGMPGHPENRPGAPMPGFGPVAGEAAYNKPPETAPGQPPVIALAKPEPAQDSCYTVTYHHKHPGAKAGDETCTHHKNLIRIHAAEGLKLNPKTVCIRVHGTPVKFTPVKGKSNEFVFGVVSGVGTAVTARYCTGKFRCNEDCAVPKDEFVEAIGGSDLDSDDSKKLEVAVWDKEDPNDKEANAKLAGDMNQGLKDLDEVAKSATEGYTLFQDWTPDSPVIACKEHQAMNEVMDDGDARDGQNRKVASKR